MKDFVTVRIESPAFPAGKVHVTRLVGVEEIGQLFSFTVHVTCADPAGLDDEAVLTHPATLRFERDDKPERDVFGMICAVKDALLTEPGHHGYELTFVPRIWKMGLSKGSDVFLDKSVPEVLEARLVAAGFTARKDFEKRLLATYPKREIVVQYKETDLAFCMRLCEQEGISLVFEHRDERDVLLLSDDNSGFRPADGQTRSPYRARGETMGVYELEATTRVVSGEVEVRDYNYRTPSVSLAKTAAVKDGGSGRVYEYGDHHATPDEAARIATIRAQEIAATRKVFEGACDLPRLGAGTRSTLDGHPRADGELLFVRVEHTIEQGSQGAGRGDEASYAMRFRAIPAKTPFRPPRVTPKPRVLGAITGIIEAAKGSQYAELDDSGRYHVRFLFDRSDSPRGSASSLLRMAQPHAGPGYGFHFPLRDGVEVLLTCIDGDPDRPIITGAVPNPQMPSTVGAKNAQRNVIRTGGGTEMNLDDTEGGTRFKVSVPHGNTVLQLGERNNPTRGFSMCTDNDGSFEASTITLRASDEVDIKATHKVAVESKDIITASADTRIHGEAPVIVIDAETLAHVISQGIAQMTSPIIVLRATTGITIDAPEIFLKGGVIRIEDSSVTITGGEVRINDP